MLEVDFPILAVIDALVYNKICPRQRSLPLNALAAVHEGSRVVPALASVERRATSVAATRQAALANVSKSLVDGNALTRLALKRNS